VTDYTANNQCSYIERKSVYCGLHFFNCRNKPKAKVKKKGAANVRDKSKAKVSCCDTLSY
jgi:hypothetical protein